ncbi:hypothetical protein D3C72_1720680 [compost metagenome]
MVHHRHQLHQRVFHQIAEHAEGVRVAQFAAQVQAVFGAGQPGVGGFRDSIEHRRQFLHAIALGVHVADGHCIEYRGDARRDDLRIMAEHRRHRRPVHAGTRGHVAFQVVRVQLHKTRQKIIAIEVQGLGQTARAFGDLGDQTVAQHHGAVEHTVSGDQLGIAEDLFNGHRRIPLG